MLRFGVSWDSHSISQKSGSFPLAQGAQLGGLDLKAKTSCMLPETRKVSQHTFQRGDILGFTLAQDGGGHNT